MPAGEDRMKKEEMRRILERADSLAELLRQALSERRYDEALAPWHR